METSSTCSHSQDSDLRHRYDCLFLGGGVCYVLRVWFPMVCLFVRVFSMWVCSVPVCMLVPRVDALRMEHRAAPREVFVALPHASMTRHHRNLETLRRQDEVARMASGAAIENISFNVSVSARTR